jgi:hypothetical protein
MSLHNFDESPLRQRLSNVTDPHASPLLTVAASTTLAVAADNTWEFTHVRTDMIAVAASMTAAVCASNNSHIFAYPIGRNN